MARHQAIRKLDLSAELADYDYAYDDEEEYDDGYGNGGGDGGDSGYEMSEEDKKQMKAALSKVKATIGHVPGCSDKAIEDLLWDYYYDVEKTVGYILDNYRQAPPPKQQQKKKQQGKGQAAAGVQVKGGGQNNKATVNVPPAASTSAFAEPSPDDKVLAAQSQVKGFGGGKAKGKTVTKSSTPADDVANGVKDINIGVSQPNNAVSNTAELERIVKTRKNLNVEEEYKKLKAKENANFVVIGHVDAGKSTLMGRLLYDLGVVDERTLKKYKQEAEKIGKSSFAFAWVLDQTSEERNRGVTIDIASNKFETENCSYTVLDAPGHKDFIPNMIAGASQADFAVLVIDSTTGEFETGFNFRGQTKEHTLLVRSMGVQRIIVAVNKLDNVNWSSGRFEEITTQIGQFLTSAGFNRKNVAFVPCSGLTGDNVTKKPKAGLMPWYTGGTLVDELEKTKPSKRAIGKPFRLTVADVFRGGIIHPVSVAGRIDAGSVQVGDVLLDMPTGEKVAVKAIEVDDEPRDWAIAGHNAVLHLGGIEIDHIRQGDILCDPQSPIPAVSTFNIKILAFESITPMMVDIHRGRLNAAGKVAKLIALYDKSTGAVAKKKPRHIPAGGTAIITVQVEQGNSMMARAGTIPVEPGTRIVLRAFGQTVAAGLVESSS